MPKFIVDCLRYLWAAPNTVLGLLFAGLLMLTGARMRQVAGVLEISGGWLASRLARYSGFAAITFGHVVLGYSAHALQQLRVHEHTHVRQAECWGLFFIPAYLLAGLWQLLRGRHVYHDHPFEKAAVAAECRHFKRLPQAVITNGQ
jgi:hypothetical protein